MGRMQAKEMRSLLADMDSLLTWHLRHNHYPPIPLEMKETALAAIECCLREEFDDEVDLPDGVVSRTHGKLVPARAVMDELHLWEFVERGDDNGPKIGIVKAKDLGDSWAPEDHLK